MFRQILKKFTLAHKRKFCSASQILTVKETLLSKPINQTIIVKGWVQSVRKHRDVHFVDVVDGTCFERLQVIIDSNVYEKPPSYGSSIRVEGCVVKSLYKGQEIELIAKSWELFGKCSEDYPILNHVQYTSEFIRQYLHLRPKTRYFSSILRIRNQASMAVHDFFQKENFCLVHIPIITQNDCEGAGEVFSVEVFSVEVKDKENKHSIQQSSQASNLSNIEKSEESSILDEDLFFGAPTYLTVSGQLHLEAVANAFSRVYSFSPTFRAESSQTRLHASEFQMIEAEITFVEKIEELLKIVEKCIKYVVESISISCKDDIKFVCKDFKNHKEYMENFLTKPYTQMSYKEAISILEQNKDQLKVAIKYGDDLATDHKRYLVKHCNNAPVFVSMFPSALKPFYMKTDENQMAHCFDLFASYGGEICGGSLREEREEVLKDRFPFNENSNLLWYLELRKYGSAPHGGFGIGFERLLQSILGIPNIRDIIPFPRRKWDCKC